MRTNSVLFFLKNCLILVLLVSATYTFADNSVIPKQSIKSVKSRALQVVSDIGPSPTITCHSDTIVNACSATIVSYSIDYINTDSVRFEFTGVTTGSGIGTGSDSLFAYGTTTLEIVAYDTTAGTDNDTCSFDITIADTSVPEVYCNDTTVYLDANAEAIVTWQHVLESASDNCTLSDTLLNTVQAINLNCNHLGSDTLITVLVKDQVDSTASCIASVTVADSIKPKVYCSPDTVFLDSNGDVTVSYLNVLDSVVENCSIADTVINNLSSLYLNCSMLGDTSVTISVTDGSSNVGICQTTIHVKDNLDPEIDCVYDTFVYINLVDTVAMTNALLLDRVSDNCDYTLSYSHKSLSCAETGSTVLVEVTATDQSGNSATCDATVAVLDTIHPNLKCRDLTLYLDNSGQASIGKASLIKSLTDNCSLGDTILTQYDFQCSDVGTIKDTVTVTDIGGLSSTCISNVTILDTLLPHAICKDYIAQLDDYGKASVSASDINDHSTDECGIDTMWLDTYAFHCTDTGTLRVNLFVQDINSNIGTCSALVNLDDDIDPFIDCVYSTVAYLDQDGNAVMTPELLLDTVYDNCSYSFTYSRDTLTCADLGDTITIDVLVTDIGGNTATCDADVLVLDYFDPRIVCSPLTVSLIDENEFILVDSIKMALVENSWDNCLDSIPYKYFSFDTHSLSCADVDTVPIQIMISTIDTNGNSTWTYCPVNVIDTTEPVAVCKNELDVVLDDSGLAVITALMLNDVGNADTIPEWAIPYGALNGGSYDACGIESLQISKDSFDCADVGTENVQLTVVDVHGNSAYCTTQVNIIDNSKPVFGNVTDIVKDVEPGNCENEIIYPAIVAVDNCGELTYTLINGLGSEAKFPVGISTETWVVSDAGENTDTLSFTVTINSYNDAPVFNDIDNLVVEEGEDEVTVLVTGIGIGDDCSDQMVTTVEATSGDTSLVKISSLVYVPGDAICGIKMNIDPEMNGEALITVTAKDNGGTENGGIDTISKTFSVIVNPVNDGPYVIGTIEDQEVVAGRVLNIDISSASGDLFGDIDDETLTISIRLDDGYPLPSWGEYKDDVLTITPLRADTGCYVLDVKATDSGGMFAKTSFNLCILDWPTGFNELENQLDVDMYPNPTRNWVTLAIKGDYNSDVEVMVMDISGKEVYRQKFNTKDPIQFDMGNHVGGMYFVKVKMDGKESFKKLILNRN